MAASLPTPARDPALDPPPRALDRVLAPLGSFFSNKVAGALVLIASALGALAWASSPAADVYFELLATKVGVRFGDTVLLEKSVQHWVNDGLMGIFFFLVGLEIKREILVGELASARKAALPGVAAIGGMVVPAAVYLALNAGGPGERGWGVPMATDIAFALGVLALAGDRVPASVKVFLTALAIVDDIGAVLVIAVFYTESVSAGALGLGAAAFALALGLNAAGVRNTLVYLLVGTCCWLFFLKSGVHATIAALLMAFTIPARTRVDGLGLRDRLGRLLERLGDGGLPGPARVADLRQQAVVERMGEVVRHATSPLVRLEHELVGPVTFVVLPLFALANAGVSLAGGLGEALASPITLGTALGLVLGKTAGVTLFTWIALATGLADRPEGVTFRHVVGAAMLSGVGFTMALFIASLAFETPADLDAAKVGILAGSFVAGVSGWALLRAAAPAARGEPAPVHGVAA